MKIRYECLPCLVNQAVKVAEMTDAKNRDVLFHKIFSSLAEMDFSKTNPEIIGTTFRLLKKYLQNEDPYREIRKYYNTLFLEMTDRFEKAIDSASSPFEMAIKYAIIANIIDFNPIHNSNMRDILAWFDKAEQMPLTIDHTSALLSDISGAKTLLYLGDNCGEICLDKILLRRIKEYHPQLKLYFGVRGKPVVNDSIEEDAYFTGIDRYATIISNGDDSLGTVLPRTSEEFRRVYEAADLVIAKGQANYESLSEQTNQNIYFLLMTKCKVIAGDLGVPQKSAICKKIDENSRKSIS